MSTAFYYRCRSVKNKAAGFNPVTATGRVPGPGAYHSSLDSSVTHSVIQSDRSAIVATTMAPAIWRSQYRTGCITQNTPPSSHSQSGRAMSAYISNLNFCKARFFFAGGAAIAVRNVRLLTSIAKVITRTHIG